MTVLDSYDKSSIGVVYTPVNWCKWVIEKYYLFEKWIQGKTFFDPTAGEGNFLLAFLELAKQKQIFVSDKMLNSLFANEIDTSKKQLFLDKVKAQFNLDFPEKNWASGDIILENCQVKVDYLVGNPPWQNFTDLEYSYKALLKPFFVKYGLTGSQSLLLGSSRIDISALVVNKTISENLFPNGEAFFFLPLSLFLNGDAHTSFRNYKVKNTPFKIAEIYDFSENIFENVATRYGFTKFIKNQVTTFPISYFTQTETVESFTWQKKLAYPSAGKNSTLRILEETASFDFSSEKIQISQKPRQGVNSCGYKDLFVFTEFKELENDLVLLANKHHKDVILPKKFVFPLITKINFSQIEKIPKKWIFLPYNQLGKPLSWEEITAYPEMAKYLLTHQKSLANRKGLMLKATINRGFWWAMLGIGSYAFAPYKVAWQSYGEKSFSPSIFEGFWQGDQSLQAFIPCQSKSEAKEILTELENSKIKDFLASNLMSGSSSFAQIGKLMHFFEVTNLNFGKVSLF